MKLLSPHSATFCCPYLREIRMCLQNIHQGNKMLHQQITNANQGTKTTEDPC
jgi:hypothetical protein